MQVCKHLILKKESIYPYPLVKYLVILQESDSFHKGFLGKSGDVAKGLG
jgi:hypothetical protein